MNDVIAPKQTSLIPGLVEASMFLKLSMSLIPNNPTNVVGSPIWNTSVPFRPKFPDDIDDSDDKENEKDEEDDDLTLVLVASEETNYMCSF